jgi:PEP-CTERM motif
LSVPKPITGGTGPFVGDLQSWTRDEALDPDWLRVGTDITGLEPFNAAFSLSGSVVPEPSTWAMMLLGSAGLGFAGYRQTRKASAASA